MSNKKPRTAEHQQPPGTGRKKTVASRGKQLEAMLIRLGKLFNDLARSSIDSSEITNQNHWDRGLSGTTGTQDLDA